MTRTQWSRNTLCIAVLSLGLGVGASAQGTASPATNSGGSAMTSHAAASDAAQGRNGASSVDRKFAEKAAIGGMYEVEMGNVAQQKASSEEVKQFGARMVTDHTKANDQLKQAASSQGITLPTSLDQKHQKEMDKLQKLSGAQFDRDYMSNMVSDHKQDISDFQKEAKSGKDSAIKSFAAQTLPTLKEHLQMAETTQKAIKGTKTSSAGAK